MSRSYRKVPIHGITNSPSEKQDKKEWHSKFRTHTRIGLQYALQHGEEEDFIGTHEYDVSNVWCFGKDGKVYFDNAKIDHPEILRK